MWVNQVRLPSEYQEVEYIGRNGNNYIDTGWKPNINTNFEVKIGYKITTSGQRYAVMGNYNNISGDLSFELNTSNKARFYIQTSGTTDFVSSNTINTSSFNDLVFKSNGSSTQTIGVNGTNTTGSLSGTSSNTTAYLFIDRALRWSTFTSNSFISYCQIYESGTLVRDFIPCYRKSDSVIGLYDLVNNQFYINSGNGTFTKGSDVPDMVEKQVRPDTWKPGANTVAYYPLNGDTNDYSGNGRNLTVSSGTMSYGNLTDRQYGSFAGSTVLTTTSIVTLGVGTLCMWTNYSDFGCPFAFTQNTDNSSNYATYAVLGTYNSADRLFAMYTESTSDRLAITSQTYPRNTRILYTLTNNGGTLSYYKNGTFIQSVSLSSFLNKSSANMRCVGGGKRGSQTFSLHKGGISEIIIENVCWTADNISNYYNMTKGNYGL